jgi:hypothetical protein
VARYNKVSGNKISAHSLRGNAGVAVLVQDDSASLGALTQYTTVTGNRSLGFLNGLKGVDDHGEFSVISGNKTGYPPPGS